MFLVTYNCDSFDDSRFSFFAIGQQSDIEVTAKTCHMCPNTV